MLKHRAVRWTFASEQTDSRVIRCSSHMMRSKRTLLTFQLMCQVFGLFFYDFLKRRFQLDWLKWPLLESDCPDSAGCLRTMLHRVLLNRIGLNDHVRKVTCSLCLDPNRPVLFFLSDSGCHSLESGYGHRLFSLRQPIVHVLEVHGDIVFVF